MAAATPIATFERTHPVTGRKQQRDAYTPAERVNLLADGWVEKPAAKPAKTGAQDQTAAAVKPAARQ